MAYDRGVGSEGGRVSRVRTGNVQERPAGEHSDFDQRLGEYKVKPHRPSLALPRRGARAKVSGCKAGLGWREYGDIVYAVSLADGRA